MERTANSDFFLFCLLFLLIIPVTAGNDNTTVITEMSQDTARQAPYTIQLFIPTQRMIHSDQINDLISGPGGETIIGTSFGLSTYNGTWNTRHLDLNNISEGLMDDYITAVELDGDGQLWIGYSGGLQIYNGRYYRSIRDQQLLKETRIRDFQRWNNDMWIATGHAGIHRYRNGTWTWYQPMTRNGPGFYEVSSMALDVSHNTLVIASAAEGLWTVQMSEDQVTFEEIASRYSTYGFLEQVRRDPRGGVYFSNMSMVVHYDPIQGFIPVLTNADLAPADISINDIAAAPDGRLFVATDDGIYIWQNDGIIGHISRFEGLGTSPATRTVTIDAKNRVWFSTTGYVGFYADQAASAPTIAIEMLTAAVTNTSTPQPMTQPPTLSPLLPVITQDPSPFFANDSFLKFLNPIIDPILKAIRAIGSRS
jgi:ligand-binding sensor domain-containing protein